MIIQRLLLNIYRLMAMGFLIGGMFLLSSCSDVHVAVDQLLGKEAPLLSKVQSSASGDSFTLLQDKKPIPRRAKKQPTKRERRGKPGAKAQTEGKRRPPGTLSPAGKRKLARENQQNFVAPRDPFERPAEILPTECPPSMPLCRFDRSQLKLVGVIRIGNGQFKGMVEDPDGRGYFVVPGMQLHNSTVTQISNKGVTLRDHKTQQDVLMRLYVESKQPGEI